MAYEGIKFRTVLDRGNIPADERLEELKRWCRIFHEKGLAPPYEGGSYGNLSFRVHPAQNAFFVTGTRIGLKDALNDGSFVLVTEVDLEQGLVYARGERDPSSESMLHFAIYRERPDVQAVFHGHHAGLLEHGVARLGLPSTFLFQPYGTVAMVDSVLDIVNRGQFLLIKDHGFLALGKSLEEAGALSLDVCSRCPTPTDPEKHRARE